MSEFTTYGRIGALERWSRATPSDKAAQRATLAAALRGRYEADALRAFREKGHEPSTQELAEAAERLRRAAQLRAALAGGRARRAAARRRREGRGQ